MKKTNGLSLVLAGLLSLWAPVAPAESQTQAPTIQLPQPGVPEIFTMEGKFVRAVISNPDRGRGDDAVKELQADQAAGPRRVQEEELSQDADMISYISISGGYPWQPFP